MLAPPSNHGRTKESHQPMEPMHPAVAVCAAAKQGCSHAHERARRRLTRRRTHSVKQARTRIHRHHTISNPLSHAYVHCCLSLCLSTGWRDAAWGTKAKGTCLLGLSSRHARSAWPERTGHTGACTGAPATTTQTEAPRRCCRVRACPACLHITVPRSAGGPHPMHAAVSTRQWGCAGITAHAAEPSRTTKTIPMRRPVLRVSRCQCP